MQLVSADTRKVTREQKNILRQQQGRDWPKRSTVWVVSMYMVKVSSNPMKQHSEWMMQSAAQGNEMAIENLQFLDKHEGRTTPSFIPKPIECASC